MVWDYFFALAIVEVDMKILFLVQSEIANGIVRCLRKGWFVNDDVAIPYKFIF